MSVLNRRFCLAVTLVASAALSWTGTAYADGGSSADETLTMHNMSASMSGDDVTVGLALVNTKTGILSGTGEQVAKPKTYTPAPKPDPATCGVVHVGAAQRCQCSSTVGPMILDYGECTIQPSTPGAPPPPSETTVLTAVRSASATLQLPDGVPVVAPDPANNEWDMIPIGYPIWLTTTAPAKAEASTVQDGISITITATRGTTVFAMGEPKQKVSNPYVSCAQMAQRKLKESPPDKKSPNCGYVYKVMGTYTIQATTTWKLTWTANQYSGTLYITRTAPAAKPLTIGQLHAVIVPDEP